MANENTGRYPIEESKDDETEMIMRKIYRIRDNIYAIEKQQGEIEKDLDELSILLLNNMLAEK